MSSMITVAQRVLAVVRWTSKASAIRVLDNRVELEFGGTFLHFGICAFRVGNEGYGVKKLGDGVWYYSEDQSTTSR